MESPSPKELARSIVKSLQGKKSFQELLGSFQENSLMVLDGKRKIITSHPQSMLKNCGMFITSEDAMSQSEQSIQSLSVNGDHFTFRIFLTDQFITCIHQNEIVLRQKIDPITSSTFLIDFLENLLILLKEQDESMRSREVSSLFGIKSPLYFTGLHYIQKHLEKDVTFNRRIRRAWLQLFSKTSSSLKELHDNQLQMLMLNHLYYLLILLTIVTHQVTCCRGSKCLESLRLVMQFHLDILRYMFQSSELLSILLELCEELHEYFILLGKCIHDYRLESEDLFRELYQQLIPLEARQILGEFYTPAELARLMIHESYQVGMEVLDPACGSGTFIVEIIRQLSQLLAQPNLLSLEPEPALTKIWGFDVHPLAVITTRVNLFLVLRTTFKGDLLDQDALKLVLSRIQQLDFLSLLETVLNGKSMRFTRHFDLIIGNPPWIVLNKIDDLNLKQRLKGLARKMDLLPPPHQVSNLEISALFFHGAKHFLKEGGTVFLIVSNAFLAGDNHSRTRQFMDFDEIEAWKFDTDLFRIHSACIKARCVKEKNRDLEDLQHLEIKVKSFLIQPSHSKIKVQLLGEETCIPYAIEPINKKNDGDECKHGHYSRFHVRKIIPKRRKTDLLPLGKSPYHEKCFNGAVLGPRNLLFVKVAGHEKDQNDLDALVEIVPVIENPKKPWDFNPLVELNVKRMTVERRCVFPAIRSINLIPFVALKYDSVFLPIEEDEATGGYKFITDKNTRTYHYFQQLDQLYQRYKKATQSLPTLWANINYQNKLVASRQRSPFKVVMQGSGTIVKAAVINDSRVIVDSTNYLIACKSLDEAYYLVGMLNAPRMTATIRLIQAEGAGGGGRHIQKRPFVVAIPKYDENNTLHLELSRHARFIETTIKSELLAEIEMTNRDDMPIRPMRLQKLIFKRYQEELQLLDQLVSRIFNS